MAILQVGSSVKKHFPPSIEGHVDPVWNETLEILLPEDVLKTPDLELTVVIIVRKNGKDVVLGTSRFPLLRTMENVGERFLSVSVLKRPDNRVKGFVTLTFSMSKPTYILNYSEENLDKYLEQIDDSDSLSSGSSDKDPDQNDDSDSLSSGSTEFEGDCSLSDRNSSPNSSCCYEDNENNCRNVKNDRIGLPVGFWGSIIEEQGDQHLKEVGVEEDVEDDDVAVRLSEEKFNIFVDVT